MRLHCDYWHANLPLRRSTSSWWWSMLWWWWLWWWSWRWWQLWSPWCWWWLWGGRKFIHLFIELLIINILIVSKQWWLWLRHASLSFRFPARKLSPTSLNWFNFCWEQETAKTENGPIVFLSCQGQLYKYHCSSVTNCWKTILQNSLKLSKL